MSQSNSSLQEVLTRVQKLPHQITQYIHPSRFPKKIIGKIGSQEQKNRRFIGFKSQI